jgi:hypothetical protein
MGWHSIVSVSSQLIGAVERRVGPSSDIGISDLDTVTVMGRDTYNKYLSKDFKCVPLSTTKVVLAKLWKVVVRQEFSDGLTMN